MFNTTFSKISVISWRSVLLAEETGVPGENHRPCRKSDKLYHIIQNILMSSDYKSTSDKTFSFNIQSNLSIATIEGNSEKGRIRQGVVI